MFSIMGAGSNGLTASSMWLNAIGDNVANSNTAGYGRRVVMIGSMPGQTQRPPNMSLGTQVLGPGLSVVPGAELMSAVPVFGQSVKTTQVPTNMAINGSGFFVVSSPNGGVSYTRAGNFQLDASGQLVLPSGARLVPPVTIPAGASFSVAPNGTVTARTAQGLKVVGKIGLAQFANPSGLVAVGQNLYQASASSGAAQIVAPGTKGAGTLSAGAVNASGVNLARELVNMVQAESTYSLNAKALAVGEAVTRTTTQLRV